MEVRGRRIAGTVALVLAATLAVGLGALAGGVLGVASVLAAERWDPGAWVSRRLGRVDAPAVDEGVGRTRGD